MKKLLLAVALTLAIFLVACGPPEQNAANGGSSDSSAPAEEVLHRHRPVGRPSKDPTA